MGIFLLFFASLIVGTLVNSDQKIEDIDIGMCMRRPPPERLPVYVAPPPFPSPPPLHYRPTRSSSTYHSTCFSMFLSIHILTSYI